MNQQNYAALEKLAAAHAQSGMIGSGAAPGLQQAQQANQPTITGFLGRALDALSYAEDQVGVLSREMFGEGAVRPRSEYPPSMEGLIADIADRIGNLSADLTAINVRIGITNIPSTR